MTWLVGEAIRKLILLLLLLRILSLTLEQAVYTIPLRIIGGENGGPSDVRGKAHQSTNRSHGGKEMLQCQGKYS